MPGAPPPQMWQPKMPPGIVRCPTEDMKWSWEPLGKRFKGRVEKGLAQSTYGEIWSPSFLFLNYHTVKLFFWCTHLWSLTLCTDLCKHHNQDAEPFYHLKNLSHAPSLYRHPVPTPIPWEPLICSCYSFVFKKMSYEWNHTVYSKVRNFGDCFFCSA